MKRNEPISKIMSTELQTVHHGQKLSEVREIMAENDIHHVPVVSGEKLVGLLSSADILKASYGNSQGEIDSTLDSTNDLEHLMKKEPQTVSSSATVRDAAEVLANGSFHCLPVVDEQRLVGLVTSTDLIRYLVDQY